MGYVISIIILAGLVTYFVYKKQQPTEELDAKTANYAICDYNFVEVNS